MKSPQLIEEPCMNIDEGYFAAYRKEVIGATSSFPTQYGEQKLLYADWIASGRLYHPIEDIIRYQIAPYIANTHSYSSETGKITTHAYRYARQIIKTHVNADDNDVLVTTGSGMTAALSKLQRIMGLKNVKNRKKVDTPENDRPVVFITYMEHHSNHVPWMETIADVVILEPDKDLLVNPASLEKELAKYKERKMKIGSFTACSNVTGMITPYEDLAKVMHRHNGLCFIDFAASAPYQDINMHPEDKQAALDAIFFSPHKFLGGPGSCGVLVFNKALYTATCPDNPGGGNVKWTNPWGQYEYFDDIETKEDGGTPGFLQVIRAALAISLKDKIGVNAMQIREKQLLKICLEKLRKIPDLYILGQTDQKRIGCVSFGIAGIHYNLLVRLLNDRFGIQVRGGWSCASTYSHFLFDISKNSSRSLISALKSKNLTYKPGWVRISLHPIMTDEQVIYICNAIEKIAKNIPQWGNDYSYNKKTNEYESISTKDSTRESVKSFFKI